MARSIKKGPFADASLLKKIDAMNEAGTKSVIKTWLVTSLESLWQPGHTEDMEKTKRNQELDK